LQAGDSRLLKRLASDSALYAAVAKAYQLLSGICVSPTGAWFCSVHFSIDD